jgi:hypothetical protein
MTPQVGVQDEDENDSWRPRKPLQSSIVMEVDEDIVDEPSPAGTNFRTPSNRMSRGMSRMRSLSLTMIRSRRSSPQIQSPPAAMDDTQGSIELGDPQRVVRSFASDEVPETQFQPENNSELETPESQKSFVLDESSQLGSYFGRVSQQLTEPVKSLNFSRTKPTPARIHYGPREEMVGGITMSGAFNHTVSSSRAPVSRTPSQLEEKDSQKKSSSRLTRQARIELGTTPGRPRNRMVSVSFVPPFKK